MGPERLVRHHARICGNPASDRWIVFVHGFGTDQSAWAAVAAAFADRHRLLLFDNAGAGATAPDDFVQHRYLTLDGYARDLVAVCRAAGLTQGVFVGHSVGAMIALHAAIAEPELCRRLVLLSGSPRYLDEAGYHGGFTEADLEQIYRDVTDRHDRWAERFAHRVMDPDHPDLARQFAYNLKAIPADRTLTVLYSIFQSDVRRQLPLVRQPTLIVQGRDDPAVPMDVALYLNRSIPGSRLAVIPARGHLPHVSAPALVVQAIRDFIDG